MAPTHTLGSLLFDVAQTMPVHLLAGASDPSGTLLPQQPLPRAMFGSVKNIDTFRCETNPAWIGLEGEIEQSSTETESKKPPSRTSQTKKRGKRRGLLVHSGQAVEDMFKYVPSPPTSRLDLAAATILWRHCAPTAPDTLWCYPYFTEDPFSLGHTPDIYAVGCQPEFATRIVNSQDSDDVGGEEEGERRCRVVLIPTFKDSGTLVLVNMRSLDVRTVEFGCNGS